MKAKKISSILVLLVVFLVQISNIKAEGMITDNTVINDQYDELFSYDVIYKDFHQAYKPEMFNDSAVVSENIEKSDYMEMEDSYTYQYKDGCVLCISSGINLLYYNTNGEYYSQILTYIDSEGINTDNSELTGFSVKEATEQCNELLSGLDIRDLVLDTAVTFSKERLIRITEEMKKVYGDHKVSYFTSFTDETEAYYLTYRQALNGIKTGGTPQVSIVITRDGIAYLDISRIIDQIAETRPADGQMSSQEAAQCFEKRNLNTYSSLPDSISVSYEIREISIAYYYELDMPETNVFHARVFPGWYIEGRETMRSGERVRTHRIRDFYRIPDGTWYYPD